MASLGGEADTNQPAEMATMGRFSPSARAKVPLPHIRRTVQIDRVPRRLRRYSAGEEGDDGGDLIRRGDLARRVHCLHGFQALVLDDVLDHLGVHKARGDAVGEDAVFGASAGDGAVEGEHAGFRGAVLLVLDIVAAMAGAAGEVDDDAAAMFAHMRDGAAAELGGRSEIDPHGALPAGEPVVECEVDRAFLINAGIVDEDIDAASPGDGLVPEPFGVLHIEQVRLDDSHVRFADVSGKRAGGLRVGAVMDDGSSAAGDDPADGRRANTSGAASDKHGLAAEIDHRECLSDVRLGRAPPLPSQATTLHYTKENHIARIVLDNPPVNVFTPALHKEFFRILKDFIADDDIHAGLWTATGDRAFCAGDDIKTPRPERFIAEMVQREMGVRHEAESLEYPGWEVEIQGLTRFKPIVSAINGYCLGQGFIYMMLLSDIRVASANAQFGLPEIKYGMGGAGGVIRLSRMIPHTSAMWMLLTGEMFGADDALRHHVVNEVVQPEALESRALEIAELIASHPPLAVRTEMEAYQRAGEMSRADALAFASRLYRLQRLAMDATPPLAAKDED